MHDVRALAPSSTSRRRQLAASADGELIVHSDGDAIRTLAGEVVSAGLEALALAVVEREIWLVTRDLDQHVLRRIDAKGTELGRVTELGALGDDVRIRIATGARTMVLVEGDTGVLLAAHGADLHVEELGARSRDRRVLLGELGVFERRGTTLRRARPGRIAGLELPSDLVAGTVLDGWPLFGGASAVLELDSGGRRHLLHYDLRRGTLRGRLRVEDATLLAVAAQRGVLAIGVGTHLALFDLHAGRCTHERTLSAPVEAAILDAQAELLVALDASGGVHVLDTTGPRERPPIPPAAEAPPLQSPPPAAAEPAPAPAPTTVTIDSSAPASTGSPWPDAAELRALVPRTETPVLDDDARQAYLGAARDVVVAWCRSAAAVAEHRGELRSRRTSQAAELASLLDHEPPHDPVFTLAHARAVEHEAHERFRRWNRRGSPHVELQHELGLSPTALAILWAAAAPQLWGELAMAYATLRGGRGPGVDEHLLAQLLDLNGPDRTALARELDPDAPLIRQGVIVSGAGERPFTELAVSRVAVRRLAGALPTPPPPACLLSDVLAPPGAVRHLLDELRAHRAPARIVIRGRPGSGRRTLIAALAHHVGRSASFVEVPGSDPLHALERSLLDIYLAGGLPCVTFGRRHGDEDPRAQLEATAVLDRYPGPLALRLAPDEVSPLRSGAHEIDLTAQTAEEQRQIWRQALRARGLALDAANELASRYDVGPGIAHHALEAVVASGAPVDAPQIEAQLRRFRAVRLEHLATRIEPTTDWSELVLPDDMLDSLRELVARVSLRGRVLDDWGLARLAGGGRGVTALFQGAPGTGKTLAAKVVARALGHELYRVDLARLVSKWLGETEKNLSELFDAAEHGQCVLLFDEADSLFAKRTEIKSSHDRYANIEVNYLLQRLDTFTGIAILTTNFGTSIDPAFKRRLSLHLQFPFPDRDERVRLWRAHLPSTIPTSGELDLERLADTWPLSGGYIRNAALRAAYLAAAEERPLTTAHLVRAVRLEYRDRAKLAEGGRLE